MPSMDNIVMIVGMRANFTMTGCRRFKTMNLLKDLGATITSTDFIEKFGRVKVLVHPGKVKETLVQYLEPVYRIEFENININ
jgi:hypothetical protein